MIARKLKSGAVAYYWEPRPKDIAAGCTITGEPLGQNYGDAKTRADLLNTHLDAWRQGRGSEKSLDLAPKLGTLRWLVERYKRSPAWTEKVSEVNQRHYSYILDLVLDYQLKNGLALGDQRLEAIAARAVDRVYEKLRTGPRGDRVRVPAMCITRMARAWDVVGRLYPRDVPRLNPWRGVELQHGRTTTRPATREEAYALHKALAAAGHHWLAVVPLVAFEWHQRPENILAGHLTWADYRPAERPDWVRIVHHKTGERVWLPLKDDNGPLFPELMSYLDGLQHIAEAIAVVRSEKNPEPRLVDRHRAADFVRDARKAAKLGNHVTLAACRHGGLTELGDAELTEQGVMALSGHRTPDAARLYVKRTEAQRAVGARKRRAWIESQVA